MRPGLLVPAVTAMVALLGSCTPTAAEQPGESPTAAPPSASQAEPVVVRECWVPTTAGNVSLSGTEARALTTRSARLGRREHSTPAAIVRKLAAAVALATDAEGATAHEVASALAGLPGAARLVCSYPRTTVQPEKRGRSGLVPRAQRLRHDWTLTFGSLPAGGFAPGGVRTGHVDGSAHYEGRAVDVFFRPLDDQEQRRRGWVFAQWVVAHASEHAVLSVIYSDHIWTSWAAYAGWRDYVHPGATFSNRGNAVLRHREHVHVAVESGRPFTGS
jgi:hypothetical protein